MNFIVTIFLLV